MDLFWDSKIWKFETLLSSLKFYFYHNQYHAASQLNYVFIKYYKYIYISV